MSRLNTTGGTSAPAGQGLKAMQSASAAIVTINALTTAHLWWSLWVVWGAQPISIEGVTTMEATSMERPVLSEEVGASYFVGDVELHLPPDGRPEVYLGTGTIDAGLLVTALPDLVKLFADPRVRTQIMRVCAHR